MPSTPEESKRARTLELAGSVRGLSKAEVDEYWRLADLSYRRAMLIAAAHNYGVRA